MGWPHMWQWVSRARMRRWRVRHWCPLCLRLVIVLLCCVVTSVCVCCGSRLCVVRVVVVVVR